MNKISLKTINCFPAFLVGIYVYDKSTSDVGINRYFTEQISLKMIILLLSY